MAKRDHLDGPAESTKKRVTYTLRPLGGRVFDSGRLEECALMANESDDLRVTIEEASTVIAVDFVRKQRS